MKHEREFLDFVDILHSRLEAGEKKYGDSSFEMSTIQSLEEISQELLDVAGWSWCQWVRLQKLKRSIV